MSAKHTPGPWEIKRAGNGDCGIKAAGTGIFAEAFAEIRRSGEDAADEAYANARLIAAAPELLEALEKIVFDWDGEPEDMIDAHAAIASATLSNDRQSVGGEADV